MASGFRESFTKDDAKDDLLGYDDTAFHYFAISVMTLVAAPWTLALLRGCLVRRRSEAASPEFPQRSAAGLPMLQPKTAPMVEKAEKSRQRATSLTSGQRLLRRARGAALLALWAAIIGTVVRLGDEKDIKKFDPFDILDVTPQSTGPQIKRAYRKLSLTYHPDKNPADPLAASRFIQITKAYQALTDEAARSNWEKYGNPDGPQTTKVGIGLPRCLLEKDNNFLILCSFFFVILFVVPATFICYYQQTKNYAANGVMVETLQVLGDSITEHTRVKNCPELLAVSAESRAMKLRPTDNAHLKLFGTRVQEHKRHAYTLPIVLRNNYIIWAHMQRTHDLMTPRIRADVDELLVASMRITQAMIEIACMREWFAATKAAIDFRRCLVQALDIQSSQLLQVPHVGEAQLRRCLAESPPVSTLADFIVLDASRRKELMQLTTQEFMDVESFCSHVGQVRLEAHLEVEDEPDVVVGDVATVTVRLLRSSLREGQSMGAVHAPLFPEAKYEEWWFFIVDPDPVGKAKASPETKEMERIVHFERICTVERGIEQELRFQVTKAGDNRLILHALCDSYAGLDQRVELTFKALAEDEHQREYKVHPVDEELDLQPTLFQQVVGEVGRGEDEEETDEERPDQKQTSSGGSTRARAELSGSSSDESDGDHR